MPQILALDHVQLAMPKGEEESARAFFVGILGFVEVPKPGAMAARGGCWFEAGAVQLHLGIEPDFRPARKAHPALRVEDISGFADRLSAAGHDVKWDDELAGIRRFFTADPFGNRIEVMEPA